MTIRRNHVWAQKLQVTKLPWMSWFHRSLLNHITVSQFSDKCEDNIWLTISFHNEWMFICIKKLFSFSSKQNSIVRNAIFYSQFNNLSLIYITICIKLSLTLQNMINRSFVRCKAMNILIFSIAWNITFYLWNFVSLCIIKCNYQTASFFAISFV